MDADRIVIIGGGITGLTTAYRLLKQAKSRHRPIAITLYEASARVGGKVLTYRDGGFTLEGGPDSLLARKPAGLELIRDLGLTAETVSTNPAATNTYFVKNGRLLPMPKGSYMGIPMDISAFLQTDTLSPEGKIRALFDLFLPMSRLDEDVSLGAFLRARLGDEWVTALGEPLLAGIYAGRIDDLSLASTWNALAELAKTHRSLIIGARSMRPRQPVKSSGRSAFVTIRGGLETIIERLADEIQSAVDIRLSHKVTDLKHGPSGYQIGIETNGETEVAEADVVIVTTPVAAMNKLLQPHLPQRARPFHVPYVSTATVILGYPQDQVNVDLSTASGFLVPRSEHRAITASTWVSSKWPHAAPATHTVLRCYVGRAGQEEYLELDDAEMARLVHQEVKDLIGLSPSPVFSKVTRWPASMPNFPVGHKQQLAQLQADLNASLPGVYVAGAGYEGLGLPDCINMAGTTATAALAFLENRA